MKLPIADSKFNPKPWYAEGLKFTCTQCGNCCTGGPGFVWISREEIVRLAEHLKISAEETVERYCHKVAGKWSLRENRNPVHGGYDCIFMKEIPTGNVSGAGIVQSRRICSIYPVRPLQCRTWPFWPELLESEESWNAATRKCPGMGSGKRYSLKRIEALRDAEDWPANAPTSSAAKRV
jgi:Fe-S-cluster containining protein